MNRLFTLVTCLIIGQTMLAQNGDNKEPALKFKVEINGEKYQVADGEEITVNGNTIKINSSDVKTFDFENLTFDYPKNFAFEFDEDIDVKSWMLDGNNFVVSYFLFDGDITIEAFADDMVRILKRENCRVVDREIKLQGKVYQGKRINVSVFGEKLTYDIYKLDSDDYRSHIISFQDSKNADGSDSKESIETIKLIRDTIKIKS